MIETSKDVLYIVLSFCLLWLTAFLCWALFYLTRLLKQSNELVTELREKVDDFFAYLEDLKEKLASGFKAAGLAVDAMKALVKHFGGRKKD
ncbi:MAG: hypothetical protein ACOZBH_03250 [Patescibacteria group bacterium]